MQPAEFEKIIIKILFQDKDSRDKILPFLDAKLFDDFTNKELVKSILFFERKFNKFPSIPDMKLHLEDEKSYEALTNIVNYDLTEFSIESLMGEVEIFFKKKLIWGVTADIAENLKDDKVDKIKASPEDLRTALAFSFDTNIGFDLLNEADRFYDYLHSKDKVFPTGIPNLDKHIEGGVHSKTLTTFVAQTNLGKTLLKCGIASNMLLQNFNVLYITLEMSEEKIGERIFQNVLNLEKEELMLLTKEKWDNRINSIKDKIQHNLIIKEYPTKGANVNIFKNLLKELEMKKKFKPDVIFIDYLGIMAPLYLLKSDNTYTEGKRVSEEIRGFAVECEAPIISSVQANRDAFDEASITMQNIADSIGHAATGDILIGVSQTEEMHDANKFSCVIMKNRYGMNKIKFSLNVDYKKMRVTDSDDKKVEVKKIESKINEAVALTNSGVKQERTDAKQQIVAWE